MATVPTGEVELGLPNTTNLETSFASKEVDPMGNSTMFLLDVRHEWVDAVCGKEFFPLNNEGANRDIGVK